MHELTVASVNLEHRLCLSLSCGQLSSDQRSRVLELLSQPVKWPEFLRIVYAQETWPLVYRNLRELGFPATSNEVRTELKCACIKTALQNHLASNELAVLLHRLSNAVVQVVPLKGVQLANSLFGDPAMRVCDDIDLLVPPSKLNRALEVIRLAGYGDAFDDSFFRKLDLQHGRHFSFRRHFAGRSSLIEVHWRLVQHSSRDSLAVQDLWGEVQDAYCFGAPVCRLSPEWQLLYLCIHAADHDWRGLKWLVDIHQLCLTQPPNWLQLKQKAERFGLDRVVRRTLATCSLLFETTLPAAYAADSLPPRLCLSALALSGKPRPSTFSHLSLLERPWDKFCCIANVVFIPKPADRNVVRIPEALSFLYYPFRAVRLIAKRIY
jgi:hypothetical protein